MKRDINVEQNYSNVITFIGRYTTFSRHLQIVNKIVLFKKDSRVHRFVNNSSTVSK